MGPAHRQGVTAMGNTVAKQCIYGKLIGTDTSGKPRYGCPRGINAHTKADASNLITPAKREWAYEVIRKATGDLRCFGCDVELAPRACNVDNGASWDHIIPQSHGWQTCTEISNHFDNLVPVCRKCNTARKNDSFDVFYGRNARKGYALSALLLAAWAKRDTSRTRRAA
jgi:hypothetical protein